VELLERFLLGGLIISAFAVVGDILRPRGFAGLFGAAPSVALATLTLTMWLALAILIWRVRKLHVYSSVSR
jgi:hypothetical protein